MPADPIFIDFLSTQINCQARSLKEAVDFVLRAVSSKSDAFSGNYNGYWLLIEKIYERAVADKDVDAQHYASFARTLILLATGDVSDFVFSENEIPPSAHQISPELLSLYRKHLKRSASQRDLGLSFFPRIHARMDNIESSLDRYIFGPGYEPKFRIEKDTHILTMGSCFAANIAGFLASFGFHVTNFASSEEASPATFPRLLESILNREDSTVRESIRNSPSLCIIFTAGVGEMLRMREGDVVDASVLQQNPARMRSIEAVEIFPPETISANILAAFAAIKAINPQAKLVCTVSPVPLEASFNNSAGVMVRNAYSKAALMLGVQQACSGHEEISYFPSFEIVKEWASLAGVQAFAANDGMPRHVSRNLVLIICLMFLKYFVGEAVYRTALLEKTGCDDLTALRKKVVA